MQNTSTSRSTDFRRQKTITSKTPLTLYGRGFCASDQTPTTTGSPAGPQSNQNVRVLPPISRNVTLALAEVRLDLHSALSTYCATKWRRMISMATLQVYCRRYPAGRAGLRACQPGRRWSVACLRLPEKVI